jgi:thymidylate synthase (FAD)
MKIVTQDLLDKAFRGVEGIYLDLCNLWGIEDMKDFGEKKRLTSMFRRIIGMGVSTGGVWTLNARALRHIMAMRGSSHAEEEIYDVFDKHIIPVMVADEPLLFGDFEKKEDGSWVPKYPKV